MNKLETIIKNVSIVLVKKYHSPRLGNKKNPLNELLYIQLSLRTTGPSFKKVYLEFKHRYPRWNDVYWASTKAVASALFSAGLSNQKAKNLKKILKKLKSDFGEISLSPIKKYSDNDIEKYLCSLPGVGLKTARCVMLYSFDRHVFPVDAHCFRIVKRLGWVNADVIYNDKAANEIQETIPHDLRYAMHVNMVSHGRAVCLDRFPKCSLCILFKYCPFGKKRKKTFKNK